MRKPTNAICQGDVSLPPLRVSMNSRMAVTMVDIALTQASRRMSLWTICAISCATTASSSSSSRPFTRPRVTTIRAWARVSPQAKAFMAPVSMMETAGAGMPAVTAMRSTIETSRRSSAPQRSRKPIVLRIRDTCERRCQANRSAVAKKAKGP